MSMTINNGFNTRIKKVQRNHARMARGYSAKVGHDGLIVFRAKRHRPNLRVRGLLVLIAAFVGFKVFVLMQIGDLAYQARIDALMSGSVAEQVGAYALQLDVVTRTIAAQLAPFFI
jgi:hypothetical protein